MGGYLPPVEGKSHLFRAEGVPMKVSNLLAAMTVGLGGISLFSGAAAAAEAGRPVPWQMNFQRPVTPVGEDMVAFHDFLLILITLIATFVLILLIYVMVKFNAKANPTPSKTTHNALLEVVWTVVPIIILVVVAVPSFKLLYFQDVVPKSDMTIKAIGEQWFWTYQYPDHGNFEFAANMVEEEDLKDKSLRLLDTDEEIVVPVDTTVKVLVTARADGVLHAWAVPSLFVKMDAVPGQINETWFKATEEGTYYGQCSELCGARHGFMPIKVRVVSKDEFEQWVKEANAKFDKAEEAKIDSDDKVNVAARQ